MTTEMPGEMGTPDDGPHKVSNDDENPVAAAIDEAEEITDPLDGLTDRVGDDPGAPFAPEVLEGLSAMKKEDRAAFEVLRAKLKKAGCHVTALDEAIMQKNGDGGRRPTQADILIDLAGTAELFHTADGTAFADLDINGHRGNLARSHQGVQAVAGAAILRGDRWRTKFGGAAIGPERGRGEGSLRRPGTAGLHPRRRDRREPLSRPR